jgi:transcriptional regulator with XRE-family HTH domain
MRREAMQRLGRSKLGLNTDTAIADKLGVNRGDMSRYLHGRRLPNAFLIAAILDLYDEPFEHLFEVRLIEEPQTQAA